MKKEKEPVQLEAFVASFQDKDNPVGVSRAISELGKRGVVMPYMTLARWLKKESRPSGPWCHALFYAGIDAYYLRTARPGRG